MIVWTGWGILTPFILIGSIVATKSGADGIFGAGYSGAHSWVFGLGVALGGLFCWLAGRWLYRSESVGGSHTLFFIPMHWIGVLVFLAAIPAGIYGLPAPSSSRRTRISIPDRPPRLERPSPAPVASDAPAAPAVPASPEAPVVSEAQQTAIRQHPDLGVAGSPFHQAFHAQRSKYEQERPDFFKDSNWPVVLADEVAQTVK